MPLGISRLIKTTNGLGSPRGAQKQDNVTIVKGRGYLVRLKWKKSSEFTLRLSLTSD
jgi:hypothetical protein